MKLIKYGGQSINQKDKKIVLESLGSELITTGSYVKKLEKNLSSYFKCKYTLSCNSGTAGLHLAFLSINIKKNDTVIIPSVNFISCFNMLKVLGAKIYLCDVDNKTGQITPELVLKCIKFNKLKNIKAIITMYLGGYPFNINEFYKIKKKFKCFLIEDACHALGASYKSKNNFSNKIGSCKHSDICIFSLHPLKSITSGEGGIISTNSKKLYEQILLFRSHGMKKSKNHWIYQIKNNGFNYRMSDINCALAYSQLKRIKKFISKRKKIYLEYKKNLNNFSGLVKIINFDKTINPSFHLVIANFNFKRLKISKDQLLKLLLKKNIICQQHYIPIFKFRDIFRQKINYKNFSGTTNYYKNAISLPIYYNLTSTEIKYVINNIKLILKKYENKKKIF